MHSALKYQNNYQNQKRLAKHVTREVIHSLIKILNNFKRFHSVDLIQLDFLTINHVNKIMTSWLLLIFAFVSKFDFLIADPQLM